MRRLVIHQPDFCPWMGFFHKLSLGNEFVVFDHVQVPNGKSWMSRNKILLNGSPHWLTIPIIKSNNQRIFEVRINYQRNFFNKHFGTLTQAYKKAPYFTEIFPIIESAYLKKHEYLIDLNLELITSISDGLGFDVIWHKTSELYRDKEFIDELKGNELVLKLSELYETDEYFSGRGCLDFILPETFLKKGIKFYFQDFVHPNYAQLGSDNFVSHLSIIDALMNIGFSGVKTLINSQNSAYSLVDNSFSKIGQFTLPDISISDFKKLNIVVATILGAEGINDSDNLLKIELQVGKERRVVVCGIAKYYSSTQLKGRQVIYLSNLSGKNIKGIESHGMILVARDNDGTLILVSPDESVASGSIVA